MRGAKKSVCLRVNLETPNMLNKHYVQIKRLDELKNPGPFRCILRYGATFTIFFAFFVFVMFRPPLPKYVLAALAIIGGVLFGLGMWKAKRYLNKDHYSEFGRQAKTEGCHQGDYDIGRESADLNEKAYQLEFNKKETQ